ncbi:MAG: HAD-IIB family hydrolase [Nitrospirae bacterium]|nr:HAD-IIB family hydrolase [Nitrospirota bacterium]
MKKSIIFTDLDGTLLDYSDYSFEAALPALQLIKEKNIPLIICSSKTRKEIEHYRRKLYNLHPFISENGGGIFIPKGYFKFQLSDLELMIEEDNPYDLIRLGAKYSDLRKALNELRTEGFDIKGFGDMTVEEVSVVTGLSIEEAEMAKERDFDEPFIFTDGKEDVRKLLDRIKKKGFTYTQGQFHHILSNSDKGKAVSILIDLYKREFAEISAIAIGDSSNDIPMLEAVDYPVIVQKPGGAYDAQINLPGLIKADGIGPEGWNNIVIALINRLLENSPHIP